MREPLSREVVVATTRRLIEAKGVHAVSLRRVAAALEVTAPALYGYVNDKGDLLQAVAEQEFGELIARFEAVEEAEPAERVRAYCRAYIEHARANPELYEVMFLFPPEFDGASATGAEIPIATKAFAIPAAAVAEAIERGGFRAIDPLQAALVMWTAAHGAASVVLLGFGFDRKTEDELVESVIDTVMRGLCR